MSTQNGSSKQFIPHLGGAKRLGALVDDYVLTMQHAIRADAMRQIEIRAKEEAGILPEFTVAEMYDYLVDSDPEFFNWMFPYCAIQLTKENLGYIHQAVLRQFRRSLDPVGDEAVNSQ